MRKLLIVLIAILFASCSNDDIITDNGYAIRLEFIHGLNTTTSFKLPKDSNGYYYLTLDPIKQTIQRISVKLTQNDIPVYSNLNGYSHKLNWNSNLYWWLLKGDTITYITKTFFNEYTGEFQISNLPPLIASVDELIPTINKSSYTDEHTGIANTVIGIIPKMKGDTLHIFVNYVDSIDDRIVKDSVKIILK